ncbi:MAG: hypothetical protein EA399_03695 [Desulfovibrionales bacterium]|nr:MAG: hypothetical protein EA399_03695 [Desulfovibrionales bacterium]
MQISTRDAAIHSKGALLSKFPRRTTRPQPCFAHMHAKTLCHHLSRLSCVTLLRENQHQPERDSSPLPFDVPDETGQPALRCRACGWVVTAEDQRITVNGRHDHVFFNPHGHVFEIGCFAHAPGAVPASSPSTEFSWFPGLTWQVVACAACGAHLGWRFQDVQDSDFFALILDRLVLDNSAAP